MWERIVLQRFQRGAKTGVRLELLEALVRRNQRHFRDFRPRARRGSELLGFGQRRTDFEIHRYVDGVREVAGGELRIRDEQTQARGQR